MRVPCKLQVPRRYANTMICTIPYVSGCGVGAGQEEGEGRGTKKTKL